MVLDMRDSEGLFSRDYPLGFEMMGDALFEAVLNGFCKILF